MRIIFWFGVLAAIALIIACFFPWVIIESKNITVSGIDAKGTSFGKPGYFHLFLTPLFLIFHFTEKLWAKRVNLIIGSLNLAWAVRNYFIISACAAGECPEKKPALFILLSASILIMLATLLPKINLQQLNGNKKIP